MTRTLIRTIGNISAGFLGGMLCFWLLQPSSANAQEESPADRLNISTSAEFRVLNPDGLIRTVIGQTGIYMYDSNQQLRVQIQAEPKTGVHLLDEAGRTRAQLFIFPEGGTHLYLHDQLGGIRTVIDEGETALIDPSGEELVLAQNPQAPRELWLRSRALAGPLLVLQDGSGRKVAELGRLSTQLPNGEWSVEPALHFYDEAGLPVEGEPNPPRSGQKP
ncbi:MAG: hypothetical protein JSU96_18580 [Acidobacteriota bacterium]|nr:MAG: hypothetical protein JSU96_18580 [Acidobacteriota bacterium]